MFITVVAIFLQIVAALDPITNLLPKPNWRCIELTWTSPQSSETITYYQIRVSTYRAIVDETDWQQNSTSISYPYRIILATSVSPSISEIYTITGLTNGINYSFAIKSSTQPSPDPTNNADWSELDTTSPEPQAVPQNNKPNLFSTYEPKDEVVISTNFAVFDWADADDPDIPYGDIIAKYSLYISTSPDVLSPTYSGVQIVIENITTSYYLLTFELEDNTSYFWRVRAYDLEEAYEDVGFISNTFIWNSILEPPTTPQILSPLDGEIVSTTKPDLDWSDSYDPDPKDIVTYGIFFSTIGPNSGFYNEANVATSSHTPSANLIENATYWWYITAEDTYNLVSKSSISRFMVNSQNETPLSFELLEPQNGKRIMSSSFNFSWEKAEDPDPGDQVSYDIVITSITDEFGNPDWASGESITNIYTTYYTFNNQLQEDTTHYWQVYAIDSGGLAQQSNSYFKFLYDVVNSSPIQFSLLYPNQIKISSYPVFLDWEDTTDPDINDVVMYQLIYSTSVNFEVTYSTEVSLSSYSINSDLLENSSYWWKVKAFDERGAFTFSNETFVFVVDTVTEPPSDFGLIFPEDNSKTSYLNPFFDWEDSIDPDPGDSVSYSLIYSTDPGFAIYVEIPDLIFSSHTLTKKLLNHTTYYWKVIAKSNISGQTESKQIFSFFTENLPPGEFGLISPEHESVLLSSSTNFTWESSTDPEGEGVVYTLLISTSENFSPIYFSTSTESTSFSSPEIFSDNQTYFWKVNAKDTSDNVSASRENYKFHVNSIIQPPSNLYLISPLNSAICLEAIKLSWSEAIDPDPMDKISYTVIYTTVSSFETKLEISGLTTNYYEIPPHTLQPLATYYWKVKAEDSYGNFVWSDIFHFIVGFKRPKPPESITVSFLESRTYVDFSWEDVKYNEDGSLLLNFLEYRIYRGRGVNNFVLIGTTSVSSFRDRIDGGDFYYHIKTVNIYGIESEPSPIMEISDEINMILKFFDKKSLLRIPYEVCTDLMSEKLKVELKKKEDFYEINVKDHNGRSKDYEFSKKVEAIFHNPKLKEKSKIFYYDGHRWINIGGNVNPSQKTISVAIFHSGRYKVASTEEKAKLVILGTSPNKRIITPNGDGINDKIEFRYTSYIEIKGKIYDLLGSCICELKSKDVNHLYWDGRNSEGMFVEPGIYIYQIKIGEGGIYNGTVVVAR